MIPEWIASPERACAQADAELFFHPHDERGAARRARAEAAKAICRGCPFMLACRDWAHERHEMYGVWGGESEDERAFVRGGAQVPAGRLRLACGDKAGTTAGVSRHRRADQPLCRPCADANRAYNAVVRERRRQARKEAAA